MSSPDPNQQNPPGGFSQPPSAPYPNYRHSQAPLQNTPPLQSRPISTVDYVQPYYGTTAAVPEIAELPALLPPAPPTSTSQKQLTEDEILAHKLQTMEVEEHRRRSSTLLSHRASQNTLGAPPSPHVSQGHLQQPSLSPRPHSRSVSSLHPWGPDGVGPPPNYAEANPLPEVVVEHRPVSFDTTPIVVPSIPAPVPHQAPYLPSPPTNTVSLSAYLEKHRSVPYPPQWVLRPPVATFFGSFVPNPKSDWLDIPLTREWRTVRLTENARNPTPPSFAFSFRTKGGSFRDPQYTWSMSTLSSKDKTKKSLPAHWSYQLKMSTSSGLRKSELLFAPARKEILTTYIKAQNYNSLRFVGPDGRLYLWVTHGPLISTNGGRFDTLRHALFASTQQRHNPLYGEIVADHAYWDGFIDHYEVHTGISCTGCKASPINGLRWKCKSCVDHDICEKCRLSNESVLPTCKFTLVNLPDEALTIRSPTVDPALVVATLQIFKDWHLHSIKEQKRSNPTGFEATESAARKSDLGRMSHWRSTDFARQGAPADTEVHGTVIKSRDLSKMAAEVANALGAIGDAAASTMGGDGGGGGGDGGGGGGDGGGGGGDGGGGGAS